MQRLLLNKKVVLNSDGCAKIAIAVDQRLSVLNIQENRRRMDEMSCLSDLKGHFALRKCIKEAKQQKC